MSASKAGGLEAAWVGLTPHALPLFNWSSYPGSCFINLLEMIAHKSFKKLENIVLV